MFTTRLTMQTSVLLLNALLMFFVNVRAEKCECVPYYQCFDNQTIKTHGEELLDVRFSDVAPKDCDANGFEVCCKLNSLMTETTVNSKQSESAQWKGCGSRNIFGIDLEQGDPDRDESDYGEFPWVVAVFHQDSASSALRYRCTGSLIHPKVVLTAAHCMNNTHGTHYIRAGEWNQNTQVEKYPHQDIQVAQVLLHPKYNAKTAVYDGALLLLDKALMITEDVNVICLPDDDYNAALSEECLGTGWGKDKYGKDGVYAPILKRVELPWVDHHVCQDRLQTQFNRNDYKLDSSFVCAGGQRGRDLCTGDGGSPLICKISDKMNGRNRYVQVGITAFGIGCKNAVPAVYANVKSLRPWIEEEFSKHNLETHFYTYVKFTPRFGDVAVV